MAREEQNTTAYIGLKVSLKETKWPVARYFIWIFRKFYIFWFFSNFKKFKTFREFFENDAKPPDILVIPLDMQISKKRGIFSADEVLDFGMIKAGDKSKQLMFKIFSTVEKSLDIEVVGQILMLSSKGSTNPNPP